MMDELIAHESPMAWLVVLWGLSAALVTFSIYRYRDVLNPMAAAVVSDVVLPCALSASAAYSLLGQAPYGAAELNRAVCVSLVFAVGVGAGCLVSVRPFDRLITWPFRAASRSGSAESTQVGRVLFLCLGIGAFGLMAVWGGGGSLWLSSPRAAYMAYRSSVGPLWALAEWCLMLWLLASIWREQRGLRVLGRVAMAGCLAVFFGSKAVVLSVILVTLMHRHLRICPLRTWVWLGSGLLLLAGFVLLLHFQSGGEVRWQMYSREYVDTVCRAFQSTDLMSGDMLGAAFLSSLWGLVPRGLNPDKPYEYGVLLLHAQLFPGMAEMGSTPGVAPWTLAYMDFGVLGAVLAGFVSGRVRDAFHQAYAHQRNSIVMFVAYVQFSLWPFLLYASPAITFALCGVLALTTRWRRSGVRRPMAGAAMRCST
jgi:hypothetical protein